MYFYFECCYCTQTNQKSLEISQLQLSFYVKYLTKMTTLPLTALYRVPECCTVPTNAALEVANGNIWTESRPFHCMVCVKHIAANSTEALLKCYATNLLCHGAHCFVHVSCVKLSHILFEWC